MALRKAAAYSKKRVRPYTRKSGKKAKAYIKAVPQNKIVKFNMGNARDFNQDKHKFVVSLSADEKVQIRDNALESGRMFVNKAMDTLSPGNYYLMVKVFPHHILRENKSAGGQAGADRLSTGMKHSFGITMGRAAIVGAGKEVFVVSCLDEKTARNARDVLAKIKPKIPGRTRIVFQKLN